MKRLHWDDGKRAAAEGKDLAAVARGLTDVELEFWIDRFRSGGTLPHESGILEAEASRRWGSDWRSGPLFRASASDSS